jgi:hypothetical protein
MKKIQMYVYVLTLGLTISSCSKDSSPSASYPYQVNMTDAPGPYKAVLVDIQGVEITGGDGKLTTMNINKGIYNLLDFSNGKDTLITTGTLDNANVSQIRLILGPNNSVVIDSLTYPLSTPSAEQSGLKLQVHQTLQAGVLYKVLLDFDANQSIVDMGNGAYKLKPVIRTIETAISGSIKGKILQAGSNATVTVSTSIDYSSMVSPTGDFIVMELPPGTYKMTISPASPLKVVTQNNITVTTGITTNVGVIDLQ